MIRLELCDVRYPLARPFRIARQQYDQVDALRLSLSDADGHVGRSEALGVDYHGETISTMREQVLSVGEALAVGVTREGLLDLLPAGGARCLVDSALWDWEAKRSGQRAWRTAGLCPQQLRARPTAFTVGLGSVKVVDAELARLTEYPVLKLKVDGQDPRPLLDRVAEAVPGADLILDANESWTADQLRRWLPELASRRVVLIEQPLPAGDDEALRDVERLVPVAADESCDDLASLPLLQGKYDAINIKLDKTGGLTAALRLADAAAAEGLRLMVGCMGGSSLSMAPAAILAQRCEWVDLDGPLLQTRDVEHAISYVRGVMGFPSPELWG